MGAHGRRGPAMSRWSRIPEGQEELAPFTVLLSVGAPELAVGRSNLTDGDRSDRPDGDAGRHWMWHHAVTALLHAVFGRGGLVISRFDDELFPLLWATARTYVESDPAEHGERDADAPLNVIATGTSWYQGIANSDTEPIDSVSAFEATGAVRVLRRPPGDADDFPVPGPGRHFGFVLFPDPSTVADVPLLRQLERVALVRWPHRRVERAWVPPRAEEVPLEDDTPPFHYLFETRLDQWLGRPRPGHDRF